MRAVLHDFNWKKCDRECCSTCQRTKNSDGKQPTLIFYVFVCQLVAPILIDLSVVYVCAPSFSWCPFPFLLPVVLFRFLYLLSFISFLSFSFFLSFSSTLPLLCSHAQYSPRNPSQEMLFRIHTLTFAVAAVICASTISAQTATPPTADQVHELITKAATTKKCDDCTAAIKISREYAKANSTAAVELSKSLCPRITKYPVDVVR